MNQKVEQAKSTSKSTKSQEAVRCEEAYRQINVIAFQKNFKVLLGHFKNEALRPAAN